MLKVRPPRRSAPAESPGCRTACGWRDRLPPVSSRPQAIPAHIPAGARIAPLFGCFPHLGIVQDSLYRGIQSHSCLSAPAGCAGLRRVCCRRLRVFQVHLADPAVLKSRQVGDTGQFIFHQRSIKAEQIRGNPHTRSLDPWAALQFIFETGRFEMQ